VPERARDWLRQAERDLAHARRSAAAADHEWACFAAQQSAEKALKAAHQSLGGEGWGHSVARLLTELGPRVTVPRELVERGLQLDKHYIPTRYPNGFVEGIPGDYYTEAEAHDAIACAEQILDFARRQIS
jgi:HEPN domain-containing protein